MVGVHVGRQENFDRKSSDFADEQADSAQMNASIPLMVLFL
jgi:hypothetical protein